MKIKTRKFFALRIAWNLAMAMLFLAALILAGAECEAAQKKNPAGKLGDPAKPFNPCCSVTGLDAATGVITARVLSTGQTFQFKVTDSAQLSSLKMGQAVSANFQTQKVSVDGAGPCCNIVSLAKGGAGNTALGQNLGSAVNPAGPCCEITSIDLATGVAMAPPAPVLGP